MFALYYKELFIVKEPLTKNRTCQTYRSKQLALCESEEPLREIINQKPKNQQDRYYVEALGF